MLSIGLKGEAVTAVTQENTAIAAKSGTLPVFATPFLAALMEQAASESVTPHLEEGQTTVGTYLELHHTAPSKVGATVRAECQLTEINGRELTFLITASDDKGPVGKALHKRFIVLSERFLQKL